MRTNYLIQTLSNDVIFVSRETFEDYRKMLEESHPEVEIKTFTHDLECSILTQHSHFITVNG